MSTLIVDQIITNETAQTSAESTAGVTPTDYSYPPGNVKRYGALGNSSNNDATAIQNAINVAQQVVTGGAEVYFPPGVYIHNSIIEVTGSNITLRFEQGARLKAGASMDHQLAIGDGVSRKEDIQILDARFDGNNLVNYCIKDKGVRISTIRNGYFDNYSEYAIYSQPTTADYTEANIVDNCQSFDGKGFYRHDATAIGRGTDWVLMDNICFRPTEWMFYIVSAQRFRFIRNIVASQSNTYNGGVFLTNDNTHTLIHTAEHLVEDMYVESNATFGSGIVGVQIENANTSHRMTGCRIENINVQPAGNVAIAKLVTPTGLGSRQHTITGVDGKSGFANLIEIQSGVAWTRIGIDDADGNYEAYINDSGSNTVINGVLNQAAGRGNTTTNGGAGDIVHNTSNDSFWIVDQSGTHQALGRGTIYGSETRDLASVASGGNATFTFSLTGVALGDFVQVSVGVDQQGLIIHGYARTNQVDVSVYNPTGGAIDLASTTWRYLVTRY